MPGEPQRWTVVFSGHVQGVGFRYFVYRLAADYDVVGQVRNEPSGSVEVIAEGPVAAIQAFVDRIEKAAPGRIENVQITRGPASDEYNDFTITR